MINNGIIKNLAIVVPVHNRKSITLQFVVQVKRQNIRVDQIIVVNDGSTDGTSEAITEKFPDVHIIHGPGDWWWTKSVNMGCRYALEHGADYILLMNDDTTFGDDYIEKMMHHVADYPDALIGSLSLTHTKPHRIFYAGTKSIVWWRAKTHLYYRPFEPYQPHMKGLHESPVLPGRGLVIPKRVFQTIGMFDDIRLPQYSADYDFVLRANRAGFQTFISWDAITYSYVEQTGNGASFVRQSFYDYSKSLFNRYSHNSIVTRYYYYRKHCKRYVWPLAMFLHYIRRIRAFFKKRNTLSVIQVS